MIEMMVAIVILGLGMLMAATMFPVGWLRARELAEFTTETSAAESAATTVRLLTNVADANAPANTVSTSFVGDFDSAVAELVLPVPADTDVHVLHIENMLSEAGITWPELVRSSADLANGNLALPGEMLTVDQRLDNWVAAINAPPLLSPTPLIHSVLNPEIAFHERIVPPLPRRPLTTDVPPPTLDQLSQWNSMLRARRFAWAVLYKFDEPLPATATATRNMTFYYVTLRRTRELQRFARQDPVNATTQPTALLPPEDMLFPVPWLVNVQLLGTWETTTGPNQGDPLPPTGLGSQAAANPTANANGRLIAQMLQPGSVLIDRLNGNIYTVREHRFTGDGDNFDHQATMTLDREVSVADVDSDPDGPGPVPPNGIADLAAQGGTEDTRDFWVFPPSVLGDPNTRAGGYVTFEGQQPVVGVETRQAYLSP